MSLEIQKALNAKVQDLSSENERLRILADELSLENHELKMAH